jgi:hypothetical protein
MGKGGLQNEKGDIVKWHPEQDKAEAEAKVMDHIAQSPCYCTPDITCMKCAFYECQRETRKLLNEIHQKCLDEDGNYTNPFIAMHLEAIEKKEIV